MKLFSFRFINFLNGQFDTNETEQKEHTVHSEIDLVIKEEPDY